jgi:hypothetical protein
LPKKAEDLGKPQYIMYYRRSIVMASSGKIAGAFPAREAARARTDGAEVASIQGVT